MVKHNTYKLVTSTKNTERLAIHTEDLKKRSVKTIIILSVSVCPAFSLLHLTTTQSTKLTINTKMPIKPNTNITPTITKGTKDGCSKSFL
jgi:hypothetical protein